MSPRLRYRLAQAKYLAHLAWRHKTKRPIVVMTYGKVGSTSVAAALEQFSAGRPVLHVHAVSPGNVRSAEEATAGDRLPLNAWRGTYVRWRWRWARRKDVVTIVRDPIARNISAVFQVNDSYRVFDDVDRSVDELTSQFLRFREHENPLGWYDDEFKTAVGVDIFAHARPSAGPVVIDTDRAHVLVLRYEDLGTAAAGAIAEFLGVDDVVVPARNRSDAKPYGDAHRRMVDSSHLPALYVARMYGSRLARHVFTQDERERLRQRWSDSPSVDPQPPAVSVVMPALDSAATIARQLHALRSQTHSSFEVIVVDNGSADDTMAIVQSIADEWPALRYVSAVGARGAAHARNVGVGLARGAIVAFCDSDDVAATDWLSLLVEHIRPGTMTTGALRIDHQLSDAVVDSVPAPINAGHHIDGSTMRFAATSNMAITRDDFERLGGFDERFRAGEDVDFGIRARNAGVGVRFVADAVVAYRYRARPGAIFRQRYQRGRAAAHLARVHPDAARDVPLRRIVRGFGWLGRHPHLVASPAGRARLSAVAGTTLGRLDGKLRGISQPSPIRS